MGSTLLEETRQYHEDIERIERLIVKDFKAEPKTHKEKLMQGHRVRQMLETLQQRSQQLVVVYEDAEGARKEEITALRGDDVFANFYGRLKEMRDYYRRFPSDDLTGGNDDGALLGVAPQVAFSGEEGFGRFLDLHEHHQNWQNAKFGAHVDYYSYVSSLPTHLSDVPRAQRLTAAYRCYLDSLISYLSSFFERTQPLAQLNRQLSRLDEEFEARWAAGEAQGWEDRGDGPAPANGKGSENILDLGAFDSADELEILGLDKLKEALAALGLKCGGTLRQRAERLMAVRGKRLEDVDQSLFAKNPLPKAAMPPEERSKAVAAAHGVAQKEARFHRLCEMLSSVLADTLGRLEKRQAQTYEELLAEAEAEEEDDVELAGDGWDDEEEEDEYIYNPLKLPLGWDGKPIPYWLYKLHGLNLEFKCEICGGSSYWGRRAFEKHFTEARHQAGMKALGIPNTKHFFEVTTIADALTLWKSLQERQTGTFKGDEEEYEDAEGNVFNKKVYLDLKRQGIL